MRIKKWFGIGTMTMSQVYKQLYKFHKIYNWKSKTKVILYFKDDAPMLYDFGALVHNQDFMIGLYNDAKINEIEIINDYHNSEKYMNIIKNWEK